MNWILKAYVETSTFVKERMADEDGVISTETAIVGAVILTAAVAVAAKFTGLFEDAVDKIPDNLDAG